MGRPTLALALGAIALAAATSGCEGDERPDGRQRPDGADSPSRAVRIALAGKGCPGTRPSREPPIPGEDFNYGNRHVAVYLWPKGRLVATRHGQTWGRITPSGSIWAKVGWWRGAPGRLYIQGERLDAAAPPLRARVPAGYGSFQSTGLTFPTPGCWLVVGSVAGHELEFVVLVTKRRTA